MVEQRSREGQRRGEGYNKVVERRGEVSGTCKFLGLNSGSVKRLVMCDGGSYGARTATGQHEGLS